MPNNKRTETNSILRFIPLFFIFYSQVSLALGLSDITLKSYLGEPLLSSIQIMGVEKAPDTACFSVTDIGNPPAFRRVTTAITPNNGNYQLTIHSNNAITEPVANLRVSYHCDTEFSREYVLLLDPPPQEQATLVTSNTAPPMAEAAPLANKQNAKPSQAEVREVLTEFPAKKSRYKRAKKASIPAQFIDNKLMEAYTGKSNQNNASKTADTVSTATNAALSTTSNSSKPQLIISATNGFAGLPNLALRLDRQIDLNRTEPTPTANSADIMDEVTMMTNRLAHLEKQITSLQIQNTQLKTEAAQAKQQLADQSSGWMKHLLIGIAIVALLVAIEWSRRKILRNRLNKDENKWFHTDDVALDTQESDTSAEDKPAEEADPFFDVPSFGASANVPSYTSLTDLTESDLSEHESILENADVFIAHDRVALAIELLQNHVADFPSESPKIWLKLLSLLVAEGMEEEYNQAVTECRQFFNIHMPAYAEAKLVDTSSLENYPHIVARLEGVWGSQYAIRFLNDLIYNQQSQPREGFGRGTFEELFFLKQLAETLSTRANEVALATQINKVKINPTPGLTTLAATSMMSAQATADQQTNIEIEALPTDSAISEMVGTPAPETPHELLSTSYLQGYDVSAETDTADITTKEISIAVDQQLPEIEFEAADEGLLFSSSSNEAANFETVFPAIAVPADEETLQVEEIDFSLPEIEITTGPQDDKGATEKADKKSNVIEWDLPK